MSDQHPHNGQSEDEAEPTRWAVVVTGYVGADYQPRAIVDVKGNPCPLLVRLCKTEDDAHNQMKRAISAAGRVKRYLNLSGSVPIPIYGIAHTNVPFPPPKAAGEAASGTGSGRRGRPRKQAA